MEPKFAKKLDARSLRGLAHPLRMRILSILRGSGPATGAHLAKQLGEDSGNISWHLRQLAEYGFISEDETLGTKRERWWRAEHKYTELDVSEFVTDPESQISLRTFLAEAAGQQYERASGFLREEWSVEWRSTAAFSNWRLRLTPAELEAVQVQVREILDRREGSDGEGTEEVLIQLQAFPHRFAPEA
ncbi:helix-turn-helix domain-containing protein [Amycolatopsis sp. H20-H5]|uniref:helix-turn-helix domain-containing protein n=1 Tax=Amycolatopsis sp. H20-H5 TaxID=3046309 RepID=UPI002DB6BD99|nr:helix-turn-helix domain-containing protein [Amycolatopsis sp. H20-H5]MEC3979960.1 helix-turn-helix domain-containing protein [Amycolatopsis sp. H20-H5]